MKEITRKEILLFKKIKYQKGIINDADEIYRKFGVQPLPSYENNKNLLVNLAKKVNEFEDIGEVETYEQLNENGKFIKWYNTMNEYVQIKKEAIND